MTPAFFFNFVRHAILLYACPQQNKRAHVVGLMRLIRKFISAVQIDLDGTLRSGGFAIPKHLKQAASSPNISSPRQVSLNPSV